MFVYFLTCMWEFVQRSTSRSALYNNEKLRLGLARFWHAAVCAEHFYVPYSHIFKDFSLERPIFPEPFVFYDSCFSLLDTIGFYIHVPEKRL